MRGVVNNHTWIFGITVGMVWMLGVFVSPEGWTQKFENQFIEFKIPENWECRVEGTEWVCMSNNPRIKKETLVVFAAKIAGPNDTLKEYLAYLQKPRTGTDLEGKTIQSEVRYARHKDIGGHTWVDALHINGEIPGFITRYLATTYQELGILVTYSVLESRWDAYEGLFRTLVDTLKPRRGTEPEVAQADKTGMTSIPITSLLEKTEPEPEESPEAFQVAEAPAPETGTGIGGKVGLWIVLAVVGLGVVVIILRRRKKAPPPTESSSEDSGDDEDDFE